MAVGDPYVKDDDLIETIFEGVVTDLETGDPISKVHVYGFDENYNDWRSVQTDEDGYYYFEFIQGGTYFLYADHDDYYQGEKVETVERNSQNTVNFELEPRVYDTRIFGVITDSETGDPISEVVVNVWEHFEDEDSWPQHVSQIVTGEDGKFSFEIYEGEFSLDARRDGYDRLGTDPFYLKSGEEYEINLEMDQWNQGVEGKVTDEEGEPMVGIVVSIEAKRYRLATETDENGDYVLNVPFEGTFTLSAQEDGYRPFVEEIEISEGDMEEVDIEMVESQLPAPILQLLYIILSLIGGI